MFESKYSKLLTGLLIAGIVIIIAVLIVLGISIIRNNAINQDASDAVEQFKNNKGNISQTTNANTITNSEAVNPSLGIENLLVDGTSTNGSKRQMYKGFPMVGIIEIPSINLKYPVLENASKDAIEVAVAVYEGVGLNKVGNTTIVGHNYRNGTFFSNLQSVKVGDKVYITDESGTKITYTVYNTYTTTPEDSSYMGRDTQGKREVTLDTCTDDSQSRFLVFAKEE